MPKLTSEEALNQIAQDIHVMRDLMSTVVNALHDAEKEVHEKMRRFVMYWHDLHDIINIFEERGNHPPDYVLREMERCDDRFRQLLTEAHTDGGTFEKVRREMAKDENNRWDHTRAIGVSK